MQRYSSFVLVGDWFRVAPERTHVFINQMTNVLWMSRLLAPALGVSPSPGRTVPPAPLIVMPSSDPAEFASQLGDPALLERFRQAPDETWASIYDGEVRHDCFASLHDALPAGALIIGFEIPPVLKRAFAAAGRDYISLHLHPIRFLRDLALGAYTNSPQAGASLAAIACEAAEITRQAARFSARLVRFDPVQSRLPEGIPLLIGQTPADSALIADGRFLRWQDRADELAALLDGNDEIAFLRHPLAIWRHDVIDFFRRDLGKTILGISGNSYAHIMSPDTLGRRIGPITTISSSLGVEAGFFGHDCRFLLADPRDKFAVQNLDISIHAPLDHRLFAPEFWEQVMSGTGRVPPSPRGYATGGFHFGENFLRGTLAEAPFAGLDGTEPFPSMEKLVIPAAHICPRRIDELASTLTDMPPGDRQAAVKEAARNRISLKFAPAPLTAGGRWLWNSTFMPEMSLVSGFHGVEPQGVWSDGQTCSIVIPLHGDSDRLAIDCEADLSFFPGVLDRLPAILIRANGMPVVGLIHSPDADSRQRIAWTICVRAPGDCIIQIECSHADSPARIGMSSDERCLGVMLHSLSASARRDYDDGEAGTFQLLGLGGQGGMSGDTT